jgi:hypothetical protein
MFFRKNAIYLTKKKKEVDHGLDFISVACVYGVQLSDPLLIYYMVEKCLIHS